MDVATDDRFNVPRGAPRASWRFHCNNIAPIVSFSLKYLRGTNLGVFNLCFWYLGACGRHFGGPKRTLNPPKYSHLRGLWLVLAFCFFLKLPESQSYKQLEHLHLFSNLVLVPRFREAYM